MAMKRCYIVNAFLIQTCIMLVKSHFSTLGNFFVPLKVDDEVNLEEGETFITQNFLSCSGTETCSLVSKEKKNEMSYQLTTERRSGLKYKTKNALWQKLKQPTGVVCHYFYFLYSVVECKRGIAFMWKE